MDIILNVLGLILSLIGTVLFKYWGWTLVAAYFAWQIWQNRRRVRYVTSSEHIILHIVVPKDNEKKELSAEQLFASLHNILKPKSQITSEGSLQDHISFEIAAEKNLINFYVWLPKALKGYVESQIYAQYPTVQINQMDDDYAKQDLNDREGYTTEIALSKDEIFPIRTFPTFEVDPLAGITTALATLEGSEEMWLQILIRPVDDSWHARSHSYIESIKNGGRTNLFDNWEKKILILPFRLLGMLAKAAFVGPAKPEDKKKEDKKELPTGQTTVNTAIETKAQKLGYAVKIRTTYIGTDGNVAKQRLQALVGGFKQFNTINLNGFIGKGIDNKPDSLDEYRARLFDDPGFVLNIEELASLWHLPHISVETPNIAWTTTKVGEPPTNLPTGENTRAEDISLIGTTTFRQGNVKFGIKREDRKRHLYIIGKSGVGKSFLLQLLTLSDIYHDHGFAVVDPHGDYAQDVMKYIPEHRVDDVIYFNPSDLDFPISFNPMENSDPNMRASIASEIVGVLKKMFADSWGPRLEHILRFTLLALLETPDATMLGITRMLTDKGYRKQVVGSVTDPVVKAFWVNEFASWNDKFASEAVAPVLNKVGAFTANPLIRNVLGQVKSSFDIRQIMDQGKILIVDLSRGRLGEDNASILGALVITKIQLAAMSRANISFDERRSFYLYVDEFQNFATESFAVILSEARKYGLFLTVANQYVGQMPEEVREAVFGNVGSMVSFRIGAADATFLTKYFEPTFESNDLVNLNIQNIYVSMSIDGQTSIPFSAKTLPMPAPHRDLTDSIVQTSRSHYSKTKSEVEAEISKWSGFKAEQSKSDDNQVELGEQPLIPTVVQKPNISGIEPKIYSQQLKKSSPNDAGHKRKHHKARQPAKPHERVEK